MTLESDLKRLSAIPMLSLLGADALRLIAFSAEPRTFQAGDLLFREGDAADSAFMVLSGTVTITEGADANVTSVGPGALIGRQALISEVVRPVTATVRDSATLLKISRMLFYRVLSEFPDSAILLRDALAADLAQKLDGLSR